MLSNIVRAIIVSLVAAVASGCATRAQQKAAAIQQNTQSAAIALKVCTSAVYSDPQYAPILAHGPLNPKDATLQQLTDDHFASDTEIALLYSIHPRMKECRDTALNQLAQTTPSIVPIMSDGLIEGENTLVELIQKKIPWGTYVRRQRDTSLAMATKLSTEAKVIESGLNQENQAELAQRVAAFSAIARVVQTEQAISAMNQPRVTNCRASGSSVNCITR